MENTTPMELSKQPENIFVDYEGVIKSSVPTLLSQLELVFKESLKDFINFDMITGMNRANLTRISVQRTEKNILKYLAKKEFDYDKTLKEISDSFVDLYMNSDNLVMAETLSGIILKQKFLNNLYIHTEEYDKRIHYDIQNNFKINCSKVHYITGKKEEVYDDLQGITSFILNDIEDILLLIKLKKTEYTNILVANYGYNYKLDEKTGEVVPKVELTEDMLKKNIFKFATFMPVKLTLDHFNG